jgi:hypothetical protein
MAIHRLVPRPPIVGGTFKLVSDFESVLLSSAHYNHKFLENHPLRASFRFMSVKLHILLVKTREFLRETKKMP